MDIKQLPVYTIMAAVVITLLIIIGYLYHSLYRYKLQAVKAGLEDEKIIKEYKSSQSRNIRIIDGASILFSVVLFAVFALSLYARTSDNYFPIKGLGNVQLVGSGSMAYKNEANDYLFKNHLDNQFNIYDLIIINEKPLQNELKLYDVVVYKKGDKQIVHRIVDIAELNGETRYILRGDSNTADDSPAVSYEQIIGIYSNKRIPMVGIFVLFLQSPLGYISMGLVFLAEFIAPYFEKKIENAIEDRIKIISISQTDS